VIHYNVAMTTLVDVLRQVTSFAPVCPFDLSSGPPLVLDFTDSNPELVRLDIADTASFDAWLTERLATVDPPVAIGRYGEDRVLYRHSPLFDGSAERRSIHLGIDLFAAAGTPVVAPLAGHVHSAADNNSVGDYGPTIILEHTLEGLRFWTLYGHLDHACLEGARAGREIPTGSGFAELGTVDENGGWPPHLHFQLITDIGDHAGDFPGVAAPSRRTEWMERCPDPNLILRIPGLDPAT